MSSADENSKADEKEFDETGAESTATDRDTDGDTDTDADSSSGPDSTNTDSTNAESTNAESTNVDKRAARQAKKEASRNAQVTIPVRAIKLVGLAVLAIAVVAVVVVSVFQVVQKNRELDAFSDSKAAASHFIETYFNAMSGPNASPKSLRDAVGPLSTGEFKERLGSDAVVSTDFMKENKVENMKTTVSSSMVESFDADRATVVLGVDITGTSAASASPASQAVLLQVEMTKVDDDWLVSSIGAGPGVTVGAQQGQQPGQQPAPNAPPQQSPAAPTP